MPKRRKNGKKAGGKAPTGQFNASVPKFRVAISRAVAPIIPDRMFTRLKATTFLTTSDSVSNDDLVIMANSAFDPFQSESALQPQGFDQWAGFYALYRVWAARIRVSSIPISATGTEEVSMVAVVVDNVSTGITSATSAMSAPFVKWRMFDRDDSVLTHSTVNSTDRKLTMRMSTQKILGISSTAMEGNPNLSCATTTNPTTNWFYHIVNCTFSGSNVCRFQHVVEIEQDVEFFDRSPIADAEKLRGQVRKAYAERKCINSARAQRKACESKLLDKEVSLKGVSPEKTKAKWSDDEDESMYAEFQAWKKKFDAGDAKKVN